MTEREFWQFLEGSWKEKGRVPQLTCTINSSNPKVQITGRYINGHTLLPQDYDKISQDQIIKIGELLFDKEVDFKTKEAIMIILAHIPSGLALAILRKYNSMPDKGLEIFAQIALTECEMWND